MISIKSLGSRILQSSLLAVIAIGAIAASGLFSPAQAASDYLLEIDGVKGESKAAAVELDTKATELQQALADLQAQMDKVKTLNDEFVRMGFGIIVVSGNDAEMSGQKLQELEVGQQVFSDQVAALLDPAVVAQVTQNFEQLRSSLSSSSEAFDTSDVSASLDAISSAVSSASESVDSLVAACTEARGKTKELTGHVTLIK